MKFFVEEGFLSKDCGVCGPKPKKVGEEGSYNIEELKKLAQEDTEKVDEVGLNLAQKGVFKKKG